MNRENSSSAIVVCGIGLMSVACAGTVLAAPTCRRTFDDKELPIVLVMNFGTASLLLFALFLMLSCWRTFRNRATMLIISAWLVLAASAYVYETMTAPRYDSPVVEKPGSDRK